MLSVIGDTTVMEAWANFHQCIAEQGKSCDRQRLMQAAGEVTYAICCRIHGEKHRSK